MQDTEKSTLVEFPLLPLRDVVVYPHMVIPLFVGREKSTQALDEAMSRSKQVLLVAQKDAAPNPLQYQIRGRRQKVLPR